MVLALVCSVVLVLLCMQAGARYYVQGTSSATSSAAAAASRAPSSYTAPASSLASAAVSQTESGASSAAAQRKLRADFSGAVFLGNSFIDDLKKYSLLDGADYACRIGLTVKTVFTKKMINGAVPVIDELKKKPYQEVFLFFGENELGWSDTKQFPQNYSKVIGAVRERCPSAKIYVLALTPVSKKADAKNHEQINNKRIAEFNALLQQVAQAQNAVYVDASAPLIGPGGYLPDEASTDGVHPNKAYFAKWVEELRAKT